MVRFNRIRIKWTQHHLINKAKMRRSSFYTGGSHGRSPLAMVCGDWVADEDGQRASSVRGSVLPIVETRSTTPDIFDVESYLPRRLRVSMAMAES